MVASLPFEMFSRQHIATLLVILMVAAVVPLLTGAARSPRTFNLVGMILGAALFAAKCGELLWYASQGSGWVQLLPLHLCDVAALVTAAMLLSRNLLLYELAYFWGMGGTLQALLTPDLGYGFPDADFWFFFVPHGFVIVGAVYATALLGMRPTVVSIRRVFLATAALAVLVAPVNWMLGTNFLYLRSKPDASSLLDFLGPWPWYILSLVPVCLFFLLLWYSPFWIADRKRRGSGHPRGPG